MRFLRRGAVFLCLLLILFPIPLTAQTEEQRILSCFKNISEKIDLPELILISFSTEKRISNQAYFREGGRYLPYFWKKIPPTIYINPGYTKHLSNNGLGYLLAHELGHYFGDNSGWKSQLWADAFALYLFGESLYKKGKLNHELHSYRVRFPTIAANNNISEYDKHSLEFASSVTEGWFRAVREITPEIPNKIKRRLNRK